MPSGIESVDLNATIGIDDLCLIALCVVLIARDPAQRIGDLNQTIVEIVDIGGLPPLGLSDGLNAAQLVTGTVVTILGDCPERIGGGNQPIGAVVYKGISARFRRSQGLRQLNLVAGRIVYVARCRAGGIHHRGFMAVTIVNEISRARCGAPRCHGLHRDISRGVVAGLRHDA